MTETIRHRDLVGRQIRDELLPEALDLIDQMFVRNRESPGSRWARRDARRCFQNLRQILEERPPWWWADQAHRTPREIVQRVLDRILPYYS